jgi:G:T-mismatch repair DNA endonuclease (very short patch repair protein)
MALMSDLNTTSTEPTPHFLAYQKLVKHSEKTKWEDRFRSLCKGLGAPPHQEQFRFHPTRLWRLDFAWPEYKIGFEVEGGIWRPKGGAHSYPSNIERDIEKHNAAMLLGWKVYRVHGKMLPIRRLFLDEAAKLLQEVLLTASRPV